MEERDLLNRAQLVAVVLDINQPGEAHQGGTYRPGPITTKVVAQSWSTNPLPEGTLLYGQLWTEGLTKKGHPAIMGRWTEALLPDGHRFPVCFVLDQDTGLARTLESTPGDTTLPRVVSVYPVDYWP